VARCVRISLSGAAFDRKSVYLSDFRAILGGILTII